MSDFNEGTILFDFRDAKREPIQDEVTLTFDNLQLKQLNFRVTLKQFPAVLPASDLAFSWPIIGQIALVNALVFPALLLAHKAAELAGLTAEPARA